MKKIISLFLVFLLLLPSFSWAKFSKKPYRKIASTTTEVLPAQTSFDVEKECLGASCLEDFVNLSIAKSKDAIDSGCLPSEKVNDPESWFAEHPMSFQCYLKVNELQELYNKIEIVKKYYNLNENDKDISDECCKGEGKEVVNVESLIAIEKVNEKVQCTEEKKNEISNKCANDFQCVIRNSSATLILGPFTPYVMDTLAPSLKANGCDASKDDCGRQLVLGFVKSVVGLFEGAWDLLKMAGGAIKNKAVSLWDKLTTAEDHTSTYQLAIAQASEDEGIFQMLKNDFTGTMVKIWQALSEALKTWLATSMFCQEWEGTPQFSECKRPATGFDCLECKTMATGLCAVSGTLIAEIVPAFITGGLVSCIKYGASAATKLAKLIKVSEITAKLIKESKIVSTAVKRASEISEALKLAKIGGTVVKFATKYARYLKIFYANPAIRVAKAGLASVADVATRTGTYIMLSKAGPVIRFGGKVAKYTGKVIIFPIDNPLVNKSFLKGEKFFDGVLGKLSKASIFNPIRPVLAGEAARFMKGIDDAYLEYKVTKALKAESEKLPELEAAYLKVVKKNRMKVIPDYLDAKPNLSAKQLIEEFFPELQYSEYSKIRTDLDTLEAEDEIFYAISKMKDKKNAERLSDELTRYVNSVEREKNIKLASFAKEDVASNMNLSDKDRIDKALKVVFVKTEKLPIPLKKKLSQGILNAQRAIEDNVFGLEQKMIARKILIDSGFTPDQALTIVRGGFVGRYDIPNGLEALSKIVIPEVTEDLALIIRENKLYIDLFKGLNKEQALEMSKAIKYLDEYGMKPDLIASTMKNYREDFLAVILKQPKGSDGTTYLAEFIRRETALGKPESVIKKKIVEAFKNCFK